MIHKHQRGERRFEKTYILAGTVASGSLLQQQPHPAVGQDTLLHREALLVVASGDAENVSLSVSE